MARKPGLIRMVVERTARDLVAARREAQAPQQGVTYLDLEAVLVPQGVGRKAVRRTLEQLARDEVLPRVGDVRMAHSGRPLGLYAPAAKDTPAQRTLPGLDLQALLLSSGWAHQQQA